MGKPTLTPYEVSARAMHEMIVMPQFADVLDEDTADVLQPSTEDGDWLVMDNVVTSRPIIDVFGNKNILKRRDATCKLIYSSVGRMSARKIETEKLYAAAEDCQEEFYQGCFEDYSKENFDVFGAQVMPLMEKGLATDLFSNRYFGDLTRQPNAEWSWNKFEGIFTWYARYIANGTLPASQTFSIPEGDITPAQANAALQEAYDRQDGIFEFMDDDDKAFYVNKKLAEAYHEYVKQSGETVMTERMSGKPILFKKGIEVKIRKWDGVLGALNNGVKAHAVILTLRGNFVYGADSKYGGGQDRNEAIRIWWSQDDDVWRRQIHLKAGTQIIAPQHSVFGLSDF